MKKYFLSFLFLLMLAITAAQPVKMAIISDVHYLSSEIAQPGTALETYQNSSGRNITDLHAILDKTLAEIEAASTDILLIAGDITNHGERASHIQFIEKIARLKERGMRVFVIPGNHDINIPDAKAYTGAAPTPTQSISANEFAELYKPFGYGEALRRDTASLSYLAKIDDITWLLCFDTNRYAEHKTSSISGGRILGSTMNWALDILHEAKAKGITVLAMMHHGIVEHMPYQATFFPNHLLDNWKKSAETLANAGLKVVFTGHFHSNDISQLSTSEGNIIYDVETGSLTQYPFPYRLMELDDTTLSIDTRFVESISGTNDLQEKYREKMEVFLHRSIESRLRQAGIPIMGDARKSLIELLSRMTLLHAKGDEVLDDDMLRTIRQFAEIMGSDDFDVDSFQLDFPPADNKLKISLE